MAKKSVATTKAAATTEFHCGQKVFIRSVTNYFTGEVIAVGKTFVKLDKAAWLAFTGRFFNYLQTGQASEVEPYPDGMTVCVGLGAIIDWCEWPHDLPRAQK